MTRYMIACFGAFIAAVVLAAPAPLPKTVRGRETGPWFTGWEPPADATGKCVFDRSGNRMTISVPGRLGPFCLQDGSLDLPRLMREVSGDFVLQVQIQYEEMLTHAEGRRSAGLVLMSGDKEGAAFEIQGIADAVSGKKYPQYFRTFVSPRNGLRQWLIARSNGVVYLRLARRGHAVKPDFSSDGQQWESQSSNGAFHLGESVQVGVYVAAEAEGKFRVTFSDFRLTPRCRLLRDCSSLQPLQSA